MAGGVPSEYEKIKALDVFEFWAVFDMWRKNMKEHNEGLKKRNRNG